MYYVSKATARGERSRVRRQPLGEDERQQRKGVQRHRIDRKAQPQSKLSRHRNNTKQDKRQQTNKQQKMCWKKSEHSEVVVAQHTEQGHHSQRIQLQCANVYPIGKQEMVSLTDFLQNKRCTRDQDEGAKAKDQDTTDPNCQMKSFRKCTNAKG